MFGRLLDSISKPIEKLRKAAQPKKNFHSVTLTDKELRTLLQSPDFNSINKAATELIGMVERNENISAFVADIIIASGTKSILLGNKLISLIEACSAEPHQEFTLVFNSIENKLKSSDSVVRLLALTLVVHMKDQSVANHLVLKLPELLNDYSPLLRKVTIIAATLYLKHVEKAEFPLEEFAKHCLKSSHVRQFETVFYLLTEVYL